MAGALSATVTANLETNFRIERSPFNKIKLKCLGL